MKEKIILENLIKKNRGALRQLTYLNNEIKELKDRVKTLELEGSHFQRVENIKEVIRINA